MDQGDIGTIKQTLILAAATSALYDLCAKNEIFSSPLSLKITIKWSTAIEGGSAGITWRLEED